ncbi:MAG: hydroxypyruvate reductase [Rhodothalassiaceae bacterium]|nr:MAG: hydroxypyruvate reductase [Rhodothalassiaceae bacterium]
MSCHPQRSVRTQMWRDPAFQRRFLEDLFREATARLEPRRLLRRHWVQITTRCPQLGTAPAHPEGRTIVVGYGKAAAALAAGAVEHLQGPTIGLVSVPEGYADGCEEVLRDAGIGVVVAGHPVPDENSRKAAERALALMRRGTRADRVLFLATGGGSATLAAPLPPLTLREKRDIVRHLVLSGAPIADINLARRHLSAVKGGRLAAAASAVGLRVTFVISDVVGDDPALVASGPSIPTEPAPQRARAILSRHGAPHRKKWLAVLGRPSPSDTHGLQTARDPVFVLATGADLLREAAEIARAAGLDVVDLTDRIAGDAEEIGRAHAELARRLLATRRTPVLVLSGGELTVRVRKAAGRGGPNLTYLATMLQELGGEEGIAALAADTDGRDGSSGHAGGVITTESWCKVEETALPVERLLAQNETLSLFERIGGLLATGPIPLNVNDFRAILIVPHDG